MTLCSGCPGGWCPGCVPVVEPVQDTRIILDALLDVVSPVTRQVVLEWLVYPHPFQEMLESQFASVADEVIQELTSYGAVCWDDGVPELDFSKVVL